MVISKETKKTALIVEGAIGIFSILTGRWTLLVIDGIAGIITSSLPESRNSKEK